MNTADLQNVFARWNQDLQKQTQAVLEAYDATETQLTPDLLLALRNSVLNSLQNWANEPLAELDQRTPQEIIDPVSTRDEAMELFTIAARSCDSTLPDFITMKLGSFGKPFARDLEELILTTGLPVYEPSGGSCSGSCQGCSSACPSAARPNNPALDEETEATVSMAVQLLGQWQNVDFYPRLLDLFLESEQPSQDAAELVFQYSLELGDRALPILLETLERLSNSPFPFTPAGEYILFLVADLGAYAPAEEIYQALRKAFRKLDRKIMGVLAFDQYGDGRAVPMLRRLLTDPNNPPDRQLYYETVGAIKSLGGNTEDIPDPFGDFSPAQPSH